MYIHIRVCVWSSNLTSSLYQTYVCVAIKSILSLATFTYHFWFNGHILYYIYIYLYILLLTKMWALNCYYFCANACNILYIIIHIHARTSSQIYIKMFKFCLWCQMASTLRGGIGGIAQTTENPVQVSVIMEPIKKKAQNFIEIKCPKIRTFIGKNTKDYCNDTTIHGLKYIANSSLFPLERWEN